MKKSRKKTKGSMFTFNNMGFKNKRKKIKKVKTLDLFLTIQDQNTVLLSCSD